MALSLLTVVANNVSGSYTPNITLGGYFQLSLSGPTVIQGPTGLALTPQIIVISAQLPPDDAAHTPQGTVLNWSTDWQVWAAAGYEAAGGNYTIPSNCRGRLYTCIVGIGLAKVLSIAFWE